MRPRLVLATLLAACPGPHATPPPACVGDPHCAHLIDAVLVPMYRAAQLPLRTASASELCRRMAIDLIGRQPVPDELGACLAQTPADMARAFMSMPEYERTQRRNFAELERFDGFASWYGYLTEIDSLHGQLFRGELRYDDFVARLLMHPGFYSRFPGDEWLKATIRVALARPAREDEIAGLRPLERLWHLGHLFSDGTVWWNLYTHGNTPEEADLLAGRGEVLVDFCACGASEGALGCRSSALGREVLFDTSGCRDRDHFGAPANLLRLTAATPGRGPRCPDGAVRPGCADREYDGPLRHPGSPMHVSEQATDDEARSLASLGAALASRDDFWEAAADRELRRFLGWWQSSVRRPDTDVPEVRRVLAAELRRTGSLRRVQELIVTSLLYASPAAWEGPRTPPPWAVGPTKLLAAEPFLDSVALALGERAGVCDFRYVELDSLDQMEVDFARLEPFASTIGLDRLGYRAWAMALGGCSADQPRPSISSLGTVAAARAYGRMLCALGREVLPTSRVAVSVDDAVAHLYRRLLDRAPSADELAAARADAKACLAAPGGCADVEAAARWTCTRIVESATFALY